MNIFCHNILPHAIIRESATTQPIVLIRTTMALFGFWMASIVAIASSVASSLFAINFLSIKNRPVLAIFIVHHMVLSEVTLLIMRLFGFWIALIAATALLISSMLAIHYLSIKKHQREITELIDASEIAVRNASKTVFRSATIISIRRVLGMVLVHHTVPSWVYEFSLLHVKFFMSFIDWQSVSSCVTLLSTVWKLTGKFVRVMSVIMRKLPQFCSLLAKIYPCLFALDSTSSRYLARRAGMPIFKTVASYHKSLMDGINWILNFSSQYYSRIVILVCSSQIGTCSKSFCKLIRYLTFGIAEPILNYACNLVCTFFFLSTFIGIIQKIVISLTFGYVVPIILSVSDVVCAFFFLSSFIVFAWSYVFQEHLSIVAISCFFFISFAFVLLEASFHYHASVYTAS